MRLLAVLALAAPLAAQSGLLEKQMALGERLARDFRRHTKPFAGPAEEYVRRVGRDLLPPGAHWQFELIKDDEGGPAREPVVFPGYIFVPERLLLMTGSEAELAGMLAHAAAHLMEPPQPLLFFGTGDFVPMSRVESERARELAADRQAVELTARAGCNPRALLDYLRRVQPPESPKSSRVPELAARAAAIEEAAASQPPREWKESTSAFADAQELVRRQGLRGPRPKPSLYSKQ
jgi:predicted Zn-dependent protease